MILKAPIGIDDFKELIEQDVLYVDKTLMIEEVCDTSAKVQLITRPRRFGKTINMSMLRYFFDCRQENSADLFRGLAIEGRACFELQGAYPVISLTFKNLKAKNYRSFLRKFASMMSLTFREHEYLLENMGEIDGHDFVNVVKKQADEDELSDALALLMRLLEQHHGKKVFLLIDEYDSPIHEGYSGDYYDDVVALMRSFLGTALKGNASLEKAVLTGILRVAKESIFSDLNNLKVFSLLDIPFSDKFGFTIPEVTNLLEKAGRNDQQAQVDQWYNGYLMGETVIYNPWSILNYLDDQTAMFQSYWVNTSANLLIHEQVLEAPPEIHHQLKYLMQGGTVETLISQHTVFRNLTINPQNLWSFLLFSGYLKVSERAHRQHEYNYHLAIPNLEVQLLFKHIILEWINENYGQAHMGNLLKSLIEGNFQDFEVLLADLVVNILSYYDTEKRYAERVYHSFVLGLVAQLSDRYEIGSNREAGLGRYDLLMRPRNLEDRGIIMEFKAAETPEDMESALDAATEQMSKRAYGTELDHAGIKVRSEMAIAFCGKQVAVRGREITSPQQSKM